MSCCGSKPKQVVSQVVLPALTIANALSKAQLQGKELANFRVVEHRLNICKSCPFNNKDMCLRCGCALVFKIGKQRESCPLIKW